MQIFFKIIAATIIVIILVCGISFLIDKKTTSSWVIKRNKTDSSRIAWATFTWCNNFLSGKYYERTEMMIPAKIEGLPYNFTFQFDLGDPFTEIYEVNARSFFKVHPELNRIGRLKSVLQFWNSRKAFKNLQLTFGDITASMENGLLKKNYGEPLSFENFNDSSEFHLGTIGADIFQNKILIIDYPGQRFAICDSLPKIYKVWFVDIQLDNGGRVILPMVLKGKNYKVVFDNGSSLFPLLVTDDKINNFSTSAATDTIKISSWGTIHNVIGRELKDSFTLGGQTFSNIKVYADYRKDQRTDAYDAITGNALFWNNTIVIDFKNKKFGVIK
jgi:hypothetical protein